MGGRLGGSVLEVEPAPLAVPRATLPTWTILVPTLGQRRETFARLMQRILPQTEPHDGRVRVCAFWNNGERPVGEVRQDLLDHATSDYVCFVDDDDLVSMDYVLRITMAMEYEPEYVGFIVRIYQEGRPWKKAYHNLAYGGFGKGKDGVSLYRDITHLNPILTKIAQQASYRDAPPGSAEDMHWINQIRGKVKQQHYINKILYHYYYSRNSSSQVLRNGVWLQKGIKPGPHRRFEVIHPNFSWHPGGNL